jgi:hypothetical protein
MKELAKAMAAFRANASIDKTGLNKFHNNSKYHTIDDLIKGLANTLDYGLGFTQTFEGNELVTTIMHLESGEKIEGRIYIGDYTDAQKWAGAVTYKRRIALVTMFGLSEPDADGNQTINTPVKQANPPKSQTPAKSPAPATPSQTERGTPNQTIEERVNAVPHLGGLTALYDGMKGEIEAMEKAEQDKVLALFKQRKAELTKG